MRVGICGGRNQRLSKRDRRFLWREIPRDGSTSIVHGGCSGVDNDARSFAQERGIQQTVALPEWKKYGKAAGPIRNAQIAKQIDLLIAFPGGRGTASMISEAEKAGVEVVDLR